MPEAPNSVHCAHCEPEPPNRVSEDVPVPESRMLLSSSQVPAKLSPVVVGLAPSMT